MLQTLAILTKPDDSLARELIARARQQKNIYLTVIDLTAEEPDYQKLLTAIFAADSVQVW